MAQSKTNFTKPATTSKQQIAKLEARGLIISDKSQAKHYLQYFNYYRMRGYTLPFEIDPQHGNNNFRAGTTFEQIINLSHFDRSLRLHLMKAIEHIEIAIRTTLANYLALEYAPHVHMAGSHFRDQAIYWQLMNQLVSTSQKSKEPFAKHFRTKYNEPLPPIWATVELMTLGQLSNFVNNLKRVKDIKRIADNFQLPSDVLPSFLHHLSTVRNTCAHHARLWNRSFTVTTILPSQNPTILVTCLNKNEPRKLYNTMTIMTYLMDIVTPNHDWKKQLIDLIDKHQIDTAAMGFPANWQQLDLWQ